MSAKWEFHFESEDSSTHYYDSNVSRLGAFMYVLIGNVWQSFA